MSSRIKLLILASIFFLPMILAWLVYFGPQDWKPDAVTAEGHLVSPARPMPEFSFQDARGEAFQVGGLWTLLHIGQAACGDECQHRLWQTRQMRTLLHRHRSRLQRVYLVSEPSEAAGLWGQLQEEHPRLRIVALDPEQRGEFEAWLGRLDVADPVLLIDPLGNFFMYYGDELPLKGMLKDIKRVMKLSNIG